jgi:holo-[acyl-carrier protein] synthase
MAPRLWVGIDLLTVSQVTEAIARFGEAYLKRLFTPQELLDCSGKEAGSAPAAERLAARFAAKEATLKALGKPDVGFDWRSVEVRRHQSGFCDLVLHGEAKRFAEAAGVATWSLSMSHEAHYATAVVVGLGESR